MRRQVRIERGLIPLIDVFALLIGATILLLLRADLEKKNKSPEEVPDVLPRLVVSCRVDGRCLYQGEIIFENHAIRKTIEAKLFAKLAEDTDATIAIKLPPSENPESLFQYKDLQTLQQAWGATLVEIIF